MKKLLLSIIISLFLCTGVYAGPWISGGSSGGSGSGDVTAASTAQTWGDGTGPVVWTFSVTGTDPTISVATGAFTFNTDLALGANDITMTGSLGATGARVTKGWFTDLEVTNAIAGSTTGNIANTLLDATGSMVYASGANTPAKLAAGTAGYVLKMGASIPEWSNSLSVTIDDSAAQFVGATTDHTGKAKIDLTTSTPTKTTTLKLANADDATITFPSVTSTLVAETVATGGVILGDTSPDAAGELGYASTQLIFHDGTAARNVAKAGTLTNTKWCTTDGTVINCAEDAPAGAGDITAVGSCTSGSCATIGNADTSGGYIDFLEDSDNGTNYVRLKAPDSTADATVTLPNTTGTLAILGANTFTADQTITGNILPEAANTRTIGSATAEWADLYLGDGAVINLGNDQDVTITHVADSGLTLAANSEDLTLAATANTWTVSSSTGVTDIKFQGAAAANAMNLATTGTILGAVKVLNAGATEGSGAHTYSPGAADIYGSMILITDSDSVTTVNLPDYQASADADHVKIGASVCVYNTVAKATIVDVAADDKITTTNGTTNAAGASVTGPATIGAFSCFMLVSASSDVGNWAQLGLNGAWPVTP